MKKNGWLNVRLSMAEKIVSGIITFCAAVLIVYQGFFAGSPLWKVTDQVGTDVPAAKMVEVPDNAVILQLMNFATLPKAKILVNGKVIGDFTQPYATVPVAAGDILEVDATYYQQQVKVKLLDTIGKVAEPVKGTEKIGKRTIFSLGKVKVSN